MYEDDKTFIMDLKNLISCEYIPWNKLQDKTILVTGATGVIGYNLVRGLLYANNNKKLNMRILVLVRDIEKARKKYEKQLKESNVLSFLIGSVESLPCISERVDYIVHGASPTKSAYFIENPVETIKTAVIGTINMLEVAKHNNVQGFVYLSSMEVYGISTAEGVLAEADLGYLNSINIRNCYPESKRQCEALCAAYASEYQIPAMSIRLAQTFGLGVDRYDSRVFAEFARCVVENKDIALLTDGNSKRCYLYTMDAVSAILTVLLKGEAGQAYNAANPGTYCSIKEMAEMVVNKFGDGRIKVKMIDDEKGSKKFSSEHFYNLGITKISDMGWKARLNLEEMYYVLIRSFGGFDEV